MIIGKIRANRDAVIELEVDGLAQRVKIEAVIDTGFTSFLMLPIDLTQVATNKFLTFSQGLSGTFLTP